MLYVMCNLSGVPYWSMYLYSSRRVGQQANREETCICSSAVSLPYIRSSVAFLCTIVAVR